MSGRIDTAPYSARYEKAMQMGAFLLTDIDSPLRLVTRRSITEYAADIREAKADLDEVRWHNAHLPAFEADIDELVAS